MAQVTTWNRKNLNWRLWSTREMLHVFHQERIEYLRDHEPRKLRKYLINTGDEEALIALDNANMKAEERQRS